jgi:hypothetical protein
MVAAFIKFPFIGAGFIVPKGNSSAAGRRKEWDE